MGVVSALKDEAKQFERKLRAADIHRDIVKIVQTGLGEQRVLAQLDANFRPPPQAIIVFGTAGAVAPDLDAGDIVLYDKLVDACDGEFAISEDLQQFLRELLAELNPRVGKGLTVSNAVCSVDEKRSIHAREDCLCVDMESTTVARWASEHQLPFACVRVIVDGPQQAVPSAALNGMKPNGTSDAVATCFALLRRPKQLPEIIRLGKNYSKALRTLASAASLIVKSLQARDAKLYFNH